jgi:hypothetical protein
VLSAQNPPTWEMLHPSEMKGLVLPDTAAQRRPRLSKAGCSAVTRFRDRLVANDGKAGGPDQQQAQ